MKSITKYSIFFTLFFVLQFTFQLNAQEAENIFFDRITSESIRVEKGLSQNTIYSIMQDNDGFMWFGTWDGLNKYDGINFTIFNKEDGLSNETIYALFQDTTGLIWIGTEYGLNTYNPETGTFKVYLHDNKDTNSISNNRITQIYKDRLGQLWICTAKGLNKYRYESDDFLQYLNQHRDNLAVRSNYINCLFQDRNYMYWLATRYGLIRYDIVTKSLTRYYHKPDDPESLVDNHVTMLCDDKEGNLWIGTQNGISKLLNSTKKFVNYKQSEEKDSCLSDNNITSILEDRYGIIWIGTAVGGLNMYDPLMDCFTTFIHSSIKVSSLSSNRIFSLYEDRIGTLWIGSFNGVNKIDLHSSKFPVYKSDPMNNSLNNNFVRAFFEDQPGIIWIGTENGINIFNENTGEFSYMRHHENDPNSLPSENIRDIFKDSEGIYWIGTADSGLIRYNKAKDKFTLFSYDHADTSGIGGNFIFKIFEDKSGNIWASFTNGLSVYNKHKSTFKNYIHNSNNPKRNGLQRIYDIYQDDSDVLWFASQNGLSRYHPESNSFSVIEIDPGPGSNIVSNKIFDIFPENDSILWLSTRGGGLVRYHKLRQSFKVYSVKDGLPNNVIYGLLREEKGNLWISTNWGISNFDPQKEKFINYGVKDGLQSNEFNSNAFLKSSNGKMYFGGMNGFNCFYPEEIKTNPNVPPVKITGFRVFNEEQPDYFFKDDTIHLHHDDNFFSIHFAALDFTNPDKNKYRYILENFDKKWRNTDASAPVAEYTKVNPGIYTFKVQGTNNDGLYNQQGAQRTIIISPPWWSSWAFRIPFGIVVIGTLWILLLSRIRGLKKKHEVEKKMLTIEKQMFDLEHKALQLQMNPHFIFNSLNSIQSFVINNDTDKAINYLAKFSQLMRLILSNSRESYIPLKNEVKALSYYMDIEKLRFDNKFDYKIQIDSKIDEEFVEIPPMIIQPYVENAIVHGLIHSDKKGQISIKFSESGKNLLCVIEDNGIGREKSEMIKKESGIQRKSRGMLITQERLNILKKQHNEKFTVKIIDLKKKSGEAAGTRVELIIHYRDSD